MVHRVRSVHWADGQGDGREEAEGRWRASARHAGLEEDPRVGEGLRSSRLDEVPSP